MEDISFAPLFKRKSILLREAPGEEAASETEKDNATRPTGTDTSNQFNIDTSSTPAIRNDSDDIPNTNSGTDNNSTMDADNAGDAEAKASVESEEKERDRAIFDTLSPQDQTMKIYTLKALYKDLYDRCDGLIKKYDTLGVEFEEYATIIKKTLDTLHSLKEIIADYYENLFDSKSYYQNDINFNCYLLVLNTIKLTTDEMVKQKKEDIDQANKSDTMVSYDPTTK